MTWLTVSGMACALLQWGAFAAEATTSQTARYPPLKQMMSWYHTTDEMHDQLEALARKCDLARLDLMSREVEATTGEPRSLDVVRVRPMDSSARAMQPLKAMFVFGVHARELISAESAMHFLRTLCGQGPSAAEAQSLLQRGAELLVVPNANPVGRRRVESGHDYCKRTNEHGVDLNRNWGDSHRDTTKTLGDENYAGPAGFSEPETVLLRKLVEEERPDLYVSVHSGAYLLGAPFGFSSTPGFSGAEVAQEVLRPISEQFCNGECPYGPLAEVIGYNSMGCDIDFLAEQLHTPFAFTWEIYTGEDIKAEYVAKAHQMHQSATDLGFVQKRRRTMLRRGRRATASAARHRGARECLDQFTPLDEDSTRQVLDNWSGAYVAVCADVASRLRGDDAVHQVL